MLIRDARFLTSNSRADLCPAPTLPEYAFIGRSNVGKSSLLNMLTGRNGLAKTSASPGKTQLINHFLINEEWYLVDLPGYGYAKVSKTARAEWARMINFYLRHRSNLMCVCVLIDSRHPPLAADLEFMEKLGEEGIPFVMVFTKIDKQSTAQTKALLATYLQKMSETWDELPRYFQTSAETAAGREEVLAFIADVNKQWSPTAAADA
jgi:GTP-binding protein